MKKTFEYIDNNFDRMIRELQDICRQPSIAARNIGMEEAAKKIFEKMKALGIECQLIPVEGGYPVLYGEIKGESDKTILFYNHYDVQPAEPLEKWTHPPFGAEIADGKIYARGVSDNKGALYSRLQAVEAMLATEGKLPVNVKFLVEGEEEIGSPNLEKFVKEHKELLKADACIWENAFKDENDNPMARLGNKGMLYIELRVNAAATDFHSRMAPIIPNAAWRLVWALSTMKDPNENILIEGFNDKVRTVSDKELEMLKSMPSQEEKLKKRAGINEFINNVKGLDFTNKLYNSPTCTICGIESGYTLEGQKTVLPCTAMAKVDFRLVVDQDPHEIVELLRKHLDKHGFNDIEIHVLSEAKPSKTPVTTPFVDVLYEAAAMVYDKPLVIEPTSAGTGPRFVFTDWSDMPIAAVGPGYSGSANHAPDENVRLEDYREAIKYTAALLQCFGKMKG